MSGHDILTFDAWVKHEYARTHGFTALIVLIKIDELDITPLRSSYFHVIGDDITWAETAQLLSGAGVEWDGVLIASTHDQIGGGPVTDNLARITLAELADELRDDRLVLNRNHFFDRWGRRMQIEEVTTQ